MKTIIITGSAGLIGSEAAVFFHKKGFAIAGIDNDMRAYFFGQEASTSWNAQSLSQTLKNYRHYPSDIRNFSEIERIFRDLNGDIAGVIHTAAQPSHDWAAKEPFTDFSINANGTLNLLELTRIFCPGVPFIFTSTNKVYGDSPNDLPLIELATRWEVAESHKFATRGIDESMSIDNSTHSLFGVSKLSADVMVQEYGKYFEMPTGVFRGGCLTGPSHSGTELHGFLSYLIIATVTGKNYTVFGYKGKQVRDNIHSKDLINAFWEFFQKPTKGEVYNMGGSRHSNISMLEAISIIEKLTGKKLNFTISNQARTGDHKWYISDVSKFMKQYPSWSYTYKVEDIIQEMVTSDHVMKLG